jgi:hypothetical protein
VRVCVEAAGAREYVLVERAGGGARPPLDRAGKRWSCGNETAEAFFSRTKAAAPGW